MLVFRGVYDKYISWILNPAIFVGEISGFHVIFQPTKNDKETLGSADLPMDPLELSRFLRAPFPGVVSETRAAPGETSFIEDVEAMMEKLGLHLTEPSFKPLS